MVVRRYIDLSKCIFIKKIERICLYLMKSDSFLRHFVGLSKKTITFNGA
jgi:hypothetical protein